ncbi:MAG TPA: TonB-dependent receptor [Caulobacteraceae bacterium]
MRIRNADRRMLAASSAAAALMALAQPGYAVAQQATYSFDIPAQDVSAALFAYSKASRQQIVFDGKSVTNRKSAPLVGEYSASDGLEKLLEGTGLRAEFAPSGAIRITADTSPQSGSAAGGGAEVEALIVTAQKREEDIQDVPIAISAFTQEDLTRSQVAGGPDLITQVPNMTFTKTNFSSYSIQLRGIGTQAISATTDPAVAVAFNNTPFIRNRFFEQEFYDLQRVEVLRGPQGTLYGRNATAGVVNIISQKPKFVAEAKLSGDLGNFSSSRVEGMINIPLVEDKVALRLAGAWTKRDGYATNELTGNPIDGRDLWSTRLSLRISPTDRLDANLIWEHFEEDDDRIRSGKQLCKTNEVTQVGPYAVTHTSLWMNNSNDGLRSGVQAQFSQGCERNSLYDEDSFLTPNGLMIPYYLPLSAIFLPAALDDPYANRTQSTDLRVIESTVDPGYRAKADLLELQVSYDLSDNLTISSETSYSTDFIFSTQDFNRFNTQSGAWDQESFEDSFPEIFRPGVLTNGGVFCDPQVGCADRLVGVDLSTAQSRQFSQEFRLGSDFEGPFNFSLGANFLRYDTTEKYYVFFNSLGLFAAVSPYLRQFQLPPYEGGVTDNSECLRDGPRPPHIGGFESVTECIYMDPNPIDNLNDKGHNYFLSKNPYKLMSYAVFGEAYYNISENLKMTAGLRWTVDKKEAPRIPSWILASQSVGYPVEEVVEQEWREPTGRLALDWKPDLSFTDETLLYASYAHGYKAGGANPPRPGLVVYNNTNVADILEESATRPKTFEPEYLDAFEIGSKNTLLDGNVTANLAAFYYDYKDYQISEIVDRSALNRNFDATIWGIELESDWRPSENLRLGLKIGYEETRIADGEQAIDLMDRTAGDPNWTLLRPFPVYPSSCILPTSMFARSDGVYRVGNIGGGGDGGCELAYTYNLDPVTGQPYDPNTHITTDGFSVANPYLGFDPRTAPNGGEGIFKDLSGNELPNAPNLTATITGDYAIPLPNEWLATLHTDLHWQGESDWRVFQDHEYSKLDEYFTMNLAAIFVNEEQGWNIMAYVKNVTDETAITGAFLNSDDTGLTTNVFLTEPRLYGLRVTKNWSGGPLLGGFGARHEGPYPWTVELGGQVQRHDAPYDPIQPTFAAAVIPEINVIGPAQNQDLDWGDGREVKVTWRPNSGPWKVMADYRRGDTNSDATDLREESATPSVCLGAGPFAFFCNDPSRFFSALNWANAEAVNREKHELIEFAVGRDIGFGGLKSSVSMGLRHAELTSETDLSVNTVPDWYLEPGFVLGGPAPHKHRYTADLSSEREFEGTGPVITWDASYPVLEGEFGDLNLDWSLSGGALFGKQDVTNTGMETSRFYEGGGFQTIVIFWQPPISTEEEVVDSHRSGSATVPVGSASIGLSYTVDRFNIGAGYRWERYFDALDAGYDAPDDADRTIDGPYFKVSLGFGG